MTDPITGLVFFFSIFVIAGLFFRLFSILDSLETERKESALLPPDYDVLVAQLMADLDAFTTG